MAERSTQEGDYGRMRLLFVLPFSPRRDAPHGGRMTTELLVRLAERHRVAVVHLRDRDEPPAERLLQDACEVLEEVERPPRPRARRVWRDRGSDLLALLRGTPMLVAHNAVAEFEGRLRVVVRSWKPNVVHIEPHEMAQYLAALGDCPAARVLVEHDPGEDAARQLGASTNRRGRVLYGLDAFAWRRFAKRSFGSVDAIVVFTETDRRAVAKHATDARLETIPFGTQAPETALDPVGADPPAVVLIGGYRHPPNADAALRLMRSIYPCVRARRPEALLQVVGADPTPAMSEAVTDGVTVTGFVPTVTPYLDRAAVVAVPLRLGGGMRLKTAEALAAGKAVVASRRAVDGLAVEHGRELLIAETDAEFCEAISSLLGDRAKRAELAARARMWACARLGWEEPVARYEALYDSLVSGGRSALQRSASG